MVLPHKNTTIQEIEHQYGVSVIVPVYNEVSTLPELTERLCAALKDYHHELIFIDDNSDDGSYELLQRLAAPNHILLRRKEGKQGKSFSIVEGSKIAKYDTIAMIDADLQYPPEALPAMIAQLHEGETDVVIANRQSAHVSLLHRFWNAIFLNIFGRSLWKLDIDVESGQKVFRKEIIERLQPHPKYAWTFDMEFLVGAQHGGYQLTSYDIVFSERRAARAKMKQTNAARRLGISAVNLRIKPTHFVPFHEKWLSKSGLGFHFKGRQYTTHTKLDKADMAVERTSLAQRFLLVVAVAIVASCFVLNWKLSLVVLVAALTTFYFVDLLINMVIAVRSFFNEPELRISKQDITHRENWYEWPKYTIFCPLYKESEVVPQFVRAMSNMDYPKDKLEVQLLLEEDDQETIDNLRDMKLPDYFKVLVVPHSMPKTKPKACNYGLREATGKYAVIYDAEDIPDPFQLKKAVVAFESAGPNIGCIQAKLNYYNWNQNLLTRLFTLEYSLWFNLVLPGLHAIGAPIPLGGTSNHFRVSDLRLLDGWDPFNVTEDADLGMRIAKRGLQTAVLDSYTLEEANSHFGGWLKQRSRWIKGYMQTYLVHMRRPHHFLRHSKRHLPFFQLIIGGKVLSMLVNPLLWLMTIAYFALPQTAEFIRSLYLGPIFYMGITALIFGNFMYLYLYMVGAAKQGRPELIIHSIFIPFYWLMMSWAAALAFRDLLIRPFHWHKTKHGLHLASQKSQVEEALATEVAS
jgi:cellulose synthase/poly-beta-1,6-N-acetylglucosamine synthase-like glycosyltransferase